MNLFEMTILSKADMAPDDDVTSSVVARATIIEMTQATEDAVLLPKDIGAFGRDLRVSIAARVAHLGRAPTLAERYLANAPDLEPLADPKESEGTRVWERCWPSRVKLPIKHAMPPPRISRGFRLRGSRMPMSCGYANWWPSWPSRSE